MGWTAIVAGLVRFARSVARFFETKQLLDAGEAKADARNAQDALAARERMDDAKNSGPHTADDAAKRLSDGDF